MSAETDSLLDQELPIQRSRLAHVAVMLGETVLAEERKELFKEADEYLDGYLLGKWVIETALPADWQHPMTLKAQEHKVAAPSAERLAA